VTPHINLDRWTILYLNSEFDAGAEVDKRSFVLDHDEPGGITSRHRLPFKGRVTAMPIESKNAGVMLAKRPHCPQELQPEMSDRLTLADDKKFLPEYVKLGLSELF
jgi:hypothetical protein